MTKRPKDYEVDVEEADGTPVAQVVVLAADLPAVKRALRPHYAPRRRAIVRLGTSAKVVARYQAQVQTRRWIRAAGPAG